MAVHDCRQWRIYLQKFPASKVHAPSAGNPGSTTGSGGWRRSDIGEKKIYVSGTCPHETFHVDNWPFWNSVKTNSENQQSNVRPNVHIITVANPVFPMGGGGGVELRRGCFSPKMDAKMK